MSDGEYANEEFGVPAVRDGIPQDPNNHNGPKDGDATHAERVARAAEEAEAETPESARGRSGRKVSDKPETR